MKVNAASIHFTGIYWIDFLVENWIEKLKIIFINLSETYWFIHGHTEKRINYLAVLIHDARLNISIK